MKRISIFKRLLILILVFILSINSFAAIVADNDGATFITKAEFDSLKNNFQAQINNYNTSIDSKIEGAIASYLAGITTSHDEQESDSWIYTLQWYNKLPTITYASSYCSDSTNPHLERNKSYTAGIYSNAMDWMVYADDYQTNEAQFVTKVRYIQPSSSAISTSTGYSRVYPNDATDDSHPTIDNACYTWTDSGGKKVFSNLDYFNYYYWNITATNGYNNCVGQWSASDTTAWNESDLTRIPTWKFEFDDKGYPKFTFKLWSSRGSRYTSPSTIYASPRLSLRNNRFNYLIATNVMLGKSDTTTHVSNPQNITEYSDGIFDVDTLRVKIEQIRDSDGVVTYTYEHDETHPVNLNVWTYVAPRNQRTDVTDITTTKWPEQNRVYRGYQWDSSVEKKVAIKGFRGKKLAVCDWYNKYSMDYEPLMLYEGAPVTSALPATALYKCTINTSASAQVNIMQGKFGRTTSGNGSTVKRYNANGSENGYAQNMACNTTLTFYIKGGKGEKYYCRINPTSTSVNSNVKITKFVYQQLD